MLRGLLLVVFIFLMQQFGIAQLQLTYDSEIIEFSDTIEFTSFSFPIEETVYGEGFELKNISADTQEVIIRKNNIDVIEDSQFQICWGAFCYSPFIVQTPNPLKLLPQNLSSSYSGYYLPQGNEGTSVFRITFIDTVSNDSTGFIAKYIVKEAPNPFLTEADVILYPNPSNGLIQLNNLPVNSSIRVYDSYGKFVLETTQSKFQLNQRSGLYFLEINGKRKIKFVLN